MIDTLLSSQSTISWRRLLVLATATALLIYGHLTPELWAGLAGLFIAGGTVERVMGAKGSSEPAGGLPGAPVDPPPEVKP